MIRAVNRTEAMRIRSKALTELLRHIRQSSLRRCNCRICWTVLKVFAARKREAKLRKARADYRLGRYGWGTKYESLPGQPRFVPVPFYSCQRCGHEWLHEFQPLESLATGPSYCPNCKSSSWDNETHPDREWARKPGEKLRRYDLRFLRKLARGDLDAQSARPPRERAAPEIECQWRGF